MNKAIHYALWAIMITFWAGIISATFVPKANAAAATELKTPGKICPLPDYMKLSKDGQKCVVEVKNTEKQDEMPVKRKRFLLTEVLQFTTPTPTPTDSPAPQYTYYAEYAPIETQPATPSAYLNAELLQTMINDYRVSVGKPAFVKDEPVCAIAESRRPELYNEIHVTGALHAGFRAKVLPYWATENMIYQNTEAQAFNWWMNSPIHRSSIEGNYSHACVACEGNICVQIFTSYTPKYTPAVAVATPTPAQAAALPPTTQPASTATPAQIVQNTQ
jgi:hypothetical protein